MQNKERRSCYAENTVVKQSRRGKDGLTGPQRRRLKAKKHEAHDHSYRVLVEVAPGKFKKSPCPRCSPLPKVQFGGGLGG